MALGLAKSGGRAVRAAPELPKLARVQGSAAVQAGPIERQPLAPVARVLTQLLDVLLRCPFADANRGLVVPVRPSEPSFAGGKLVQGHLQVCERLKLSGRPAGRLKPLRALIAALSGAVELPQGVFAAAAVVWHSCLRPLGNRAARQERG